MHGHSSRRLLSGDAGSAVVEFTLVSVLTVAVFLGVLQVALVLHARNVVVAAAAEGAREAARADRTCADGAVLAHGLVARALSPRVAGSLSYGVPPAGCAVVADDGLVLAAVRVHGRVPLFLLPVASIGVDATAHSIEEGQ